MPKNPKVPTMGRAAINYLVSVYAAGDSPGTTGDIRKKLANVNPKYGKYPLRRFGEWDRQARLELAKGLVSTGNPVYQNQYKRIAKPTAKERKVGKDVRLKDTKTRAFNDGLEARADAAQDDATQEEKSTAKMYQAVEAALEAIELLRG